MLLRGIVRYALGGLLGIVAPGSPSFAQPARVFGPDSKSTGVRTRQSRNGRSTADLDRPGLHRRPVPPHRSAAHVRRAPVNDGNYPIAACFGDLGHPRAANKPLEMSYALDRVLEWLGFYLLGKGGAAETPKIGTARE